MPKVGTKPAKPQRLTLSDLLDLRKLAAFMGWSWGDTEVRVRDHGLSQGYRTERFTAEENIQRQWTKLRWGLVEDWGKHPLNLHKHQTRDNYVRQMAREEFGIKGKTAEQVRLACLLAHPDLYEKPDPKPEPKPDISWMHGRKPDAQTRD